MTMGSYFVEWSGKTVRKEDLNRIVNNKKEHVRRIAGKEHSRWRHGQGRSLEMGVSLMSVTGFSLEGKRNDYGKASQAHKGLQVRVVGSDLF